MSIMALSSLFSILLLIQNIALSAYRAKKDDDAVIYYKKIADQRIAGKDNVDVYQLLIEYYIEKE